MDNSLLEVPLASELSDRFKAEFAGQIIAAITGGLLAILLARLLNPDGYGLLSLSLSVFAILEILSRLGIGKSAARYIAEYKQLDSGQIPHILRFSFFLNVSLIIVVSVIVWLTSSWLAAKLNEPDLAPLLALGAFYISFKTLATFSRVILQGFEAIKTTASLNALDRSTRLLFAIGLVVFGYGAVGALIGYILSSAIASIIGLAIIYNRYYKNERRSDFDVNLRKRIVEYSIPLTATHTSGAINHRLDTVLVGFFTSPIEVAYYTVSRQIVEFINTPMAAAGFTLSPTFASQVANGNLDVATQLYEDSLEYTLVFYLPAATGLFLVSDPFINHTFGNEYSNAVPVLKVLSFYILLLAIKQLTDNGLDYLGRARDRAILKAGAAISNVILNIILIPWIGVIGAAIATVLTEGVYVIMTVSIMNTELPIDYWNISLTIGKSLFSTLVMAVSVLLLLNYVTGFVTLSIIITIGLVVYLTLSIIIGTLEIEQVK